MANRLEPKVLKSCQHAFMHVLSDFILLGLIGLIDGRVYVAICIM